MKKINRSYKCCTGDWNHFLAYQSDDADQTVEHWRITRLHSIMLGKLKLRISFMLIMYYPTCDTFKVKDFLFYVLLKIAFLATRQIKEQVKFTLHEAIWVYPLAFHVATWAKSDLCDYFISILFQYPFQGEIALFYLVLTSFSFEIISMAEMDCHSHSVIYF